MSCVDSTKPCLPPGSTRQTVLDDRIRGLCASPPRRAEVSAWAALRRDGVPSARYLGIIEEGARELGLVDYADALSKRPRANPSGFLRAVAGAHGVVSLTLYRRNLSHLLAPLRSACFVLTYGGRRPWLRALSEALTAAVLLPTAAVGSVIRLYRSARGLPPIVFGPPE